ncbi:MAG: sensor histidine kinase [Gammaproteobacteria bacterium]|nr:sensor histidine kinase [Gammaproteobacteria bacterium]
MRSIQSRLSLGLLLSLVVIFALQWIMVSHTVRLLAEHYISERLMHDAENLLRSIVITPPAQAALEQTAIDPIFRRPFSGRYYQIVIGDQTYRSRSLWDQALSDADPGSTPATGTFIPGPQAQTLLLWSKQFHKQGVAIRIAVAEDFNPIEQDLQAFRLGYAIASLLALAVLVGILTLIIQRGFAPLGRTREDLQRLERGEISAINEDVPSEVAPLVREVNHLLENLHQRLQRSRNALGNLTHAMKTPLTHLQQLAYRDELNDRPELRDRLLAQTTQLQQLIDRELTRARLAGHRMPGQRLDIATEVAALTESLLAIYRERKINIHSQLDLTQGVSMDREDFLELLGNLLDNACKWARHEVKLHIRDADGLQIQVEDDGPGCAEHELEKLTQRGLRIDEKTVGHGLGLAIAQDIVDSYHGSFRLDLSPDLGGLRARVTLST